ncbi:Ff.00g062640.m01.CDS01 [Fusarium sp. VM40]|nr:Ff.00g062640.m01.CDS01 [Fusarium sp. VM40]
MVQSLTTFLEKQIADRWGPSRNDTKEEAARRFTADCAAARTPTVTQGHLPAMWKLVENVARKYPDHHEKLVGLLYEVHGLPELVIRGETAVVWSELPSLVEGWDEIYNRPENQYSEEIVSVIGFITKLLTAKLIPLDEFLRWVDLNMHTALEKGPEDLST